MECAERGIIGTRASRGQVVSKFSGGIGHEGGERKGLGRESTGGRSP